MFILIGGNGFIGRAVKDSLLRDHHNVIVIGRRFDERSSEMGMFYSVEETSLTEISDSLPLNENYIIVDFAYTSVPITSVEAPIKDFSENLLNVINHLEFASRIKAKRYIYVSSGGTIYGNVSDSPIKEDESNFPISPYGITKMACERYVNMYHSLYGLNTCIIRPSNVYGPSQKPFRGQGFIATALALSYNQRPVSIFGKGTIVRDYLYIDDFCDALKDVIQMGENGDIYNIGHGEGFSINEVVQLMDRILSKDGNKLFKNYLQERPFDVKSNVLDCKKLNKLNNWQPKVDLTTGIENTWRWMKDYMKSNP